MPSEHQTAASPNTVASTPVLRASLTRAREALVTETLRGRGGVEALATYSEQVDTLLRQIFHHARATTSEPVALVAVGGYGRKQLCLYSDIDLLIVFGNAIGAAEERFLKAMLHPLWDLRLDVGHHVRDLSDFKTPDDDNPEYLVALRDARFLDGDIEVFQQFADACLRPESVWREPTLAALRDLVAQRYSQHDGTLYHLEPDVKDAPGGLRDVSAARMLVQLAGIVWPGGVQIGRVDEAEDFLLRIRSLLHHERGRNLNVLTHELQETVAERFGLLEARSERRVEALMSTFFHHARIINRALRLTRKALSPAPVTAPVVLTDDVQRWGDEIWFTDGTRASLQPQMWLHAFEAALDETCSVSDQVLTCVERHGERYAPERYFPSTADRDRLLRVLRPRPGLYARLSEMHDSGLLGRMFPEFQKIYCFVIRDFYHKYTVDEHTLLTIKNLESLCDPTTRSRARFAGLMAELPAPELMVLALVFHDVGKWTNKNHAEEGVRMALTALRRIKLAEQSTATVEFLIRHHLQMSTVAFRRDTEDPDVVVQFARLVGTEERLKLLCLLTLADVAAVSPDVMTPWKEELLWQLYVDTYNRLTLGYGDEVIDAEATQLSQLTRTRPKDIAEADVEQFVRGLPQRYLRLVDTTRFYDHVRLARNLGPLDLHWTLEEKDSIWELTVASVDQPRLFSRICGVLSFFGMDILRGQAMTNRAGLALDMFQFTDRDQFLSLNTSGRQELGSLLEDVVAGRRDIDRTLEPKARGLARTGPARVRTVVHCDNDYSPRFTIFEIVAQDAWGLLYRISRVISRHECDIDLVLISTEGARAIDVFHLTKDGAKLQFDDATRLQTDLKQVLEDHEVDQGHRSAKQS